jgi:ketosteroid isomerase-like protein
MGSLAAMSQENVEIVRTIYRLWGEDRSAGDLIDRELEYVNPPYAIESGTINSRRALGRIREVYPDFRVEPERFVEAGDDVVVIGVAHGTTASGVATQSRQGYVWTIRDGKAVRFSWFNEPGEALNAVGLNE